MLGLFFYGGLDSVPREKLRDPAMTTKDNPLADKNGPNYEALVVNRNENRLIRDAEMRACPFNGRVYAGIMDTRYGSQKEE